MIHFWLLLDPACQARYLQDNSQTHSPPPALILEQANELIYTLLDRIAEREDRLIQNSRNSSKPPSSDGPAGTASARKRPASGKARGTQHVHKGQRRERHPQDERLVIAAHYPVPDCPCYGSQVLAHPKPYRVHQVFELPAVSYLVTEHQVYRATGRHCITIAQAQLP